MQTQKAHKNPILAIITLFIIFFNVIMLMYPKEILSASKDGLLMWFNLVLPSLLPFMMLSQILILLGFVDTLSRYFSPLMRIFGTSGNGTFPLIMGLICGYPMGARITAELYKKEMLTKNEAQALLGFSNNAGPLFIIGTIGVNMLSDPVKGYKIWLCHILSAIITGLLLRNSTPPKPSAIPEKPQVKMTIGEILSQAVFTSMEGILAIGGFIILFSVISKALSISGIISLLSLIPNKLGFREASGVLCGILEITNGCRALCTSDDFLTLPLVTAIISWGGFSIHAQAISFFSETDLSSVKYILSKLLQAIIAFLICLLLQ